MRVRIKKKKVKQIVQKLGSDQMAGNPFALIIFTELFNCGGDIDKEIVIVQKWERKLKRMGKRLLGVFA